MAPIAAALARGAAVALLAFYYSLGNAVAETVPCTRADNLVIVEATLNGSRPLAFVLDTGAAHMVVDDAIARELALPTSGETTIGGAGAGRIPVRKIERVAFAIGHLAPADYDFVATDLSGLTTLLGRRVDGIIGYAFFNQHIVTIRYARNELEIRDADAKDELPGEPLPIRIEKGWAFLRATVRVAGSREVSDDFLVDSGSNDAVDHPIAKQARDRASTTTGNGLGAPVPGFIATAESLRIGRHELHDLPMSSGGGSEQTSKLIGGGVLSRFVVTFDYPHSRMFLADQQ